MPKVVKPIMEGLAPISEVARKKLSDKFKGQDFLIGLDPALLLGEPSVVSASLIFIPLSLLIALIVPGNRILPFGDLATIGFFVAMAVGIHKGNMFRTIISGSIIMYITIWIANRTIEYHTILAQNAGIQNTIEVASLDQGGSPITYIVTSIFQNSMISKDVVGFIVILVLYVIGIIMTKMRYSKLVKAQNDKVNNN